MEVCSCGLIKQSKAGTRLDEGGTEVCNNCLKPVSLEAAVRAGVTAGSVHPVAFYGVSPDRMTTLANVPGHRILRSLGVVTELAATSGFTATSKGNAALDLAMENLRRSAGRMGANAIVGLHSSAFGAAGGITSAFGGDAVGVLLMGTAVVVEAHPASAPEAEHSDP